MEMTKEITTDSIVREILESDVIYEHRTITDVTDDRDKVFTWYSENTKHQRSVRTAIHFTSQKTGGRMVFTSKSPDDYLNLLLQAQRKGHLNLRDLRKVDQEIRCQKCNGLGFIESYAHVHNGVCFKCGGTGRK